MKKNLFVRAFILLLCAGSLSSGAQGTCGTPAPSQQWEAWFGKQVDAYLQKRAASKTNIVQYTIPVIVHIIHFGETYGTYPNIDSNEVISQIAALNADFAGSGFNSQNVPSAFASLKANTGIQFCLALKDYTGTPMIERGTERINAASNSWQSPATATLNLYQYFNSVIIPATIWPPDKYLNIWVSDKPANYPMNGFATYPSGSGLIGLFGGQYGTTTNDGIWIYAHAFGTMGAAQAPTDKGRTTTHQVGHWLGLRHTWGDGNCLSDYVTDTPVQKAANTGCPTHPLNIDACGVNQSPYGEMFMNFMDETDDACKYMFTNGQNVRMQTAMNQAPLRYPLGTHNICHLAAQASSSAIASFDAPQDACYNSPFMPFNTSSGWPSPTFLWSSNPNAQFVPNTSVASPMVTFQNPGTYTLSLVATNSVSSSTYSMVITTNFTCAAQSVCLDSIRMIKVPDTLTIYNAPQSSFVLACQPGHPTGNLAGTNCYKDREFAQFYPPSTYTSVPFPQVHSLIVLFDSARTVHSANSPTNAGVTAKIYGGSGSVGPVGVMGTPKLELLSAIVATTKTTSVTYVGKPGFVQTNRKIIPYKINFNQPVIVNTPNTGFFAAIEGPNLYPNDSIAIYTNTKYNSSTDSSAWFMNMNGTWRTFRYDRQSKVQLAIIPQISCSPIVGLKENARLLTNNVTVVPNPGTGLFNLVFTLDRPADEISIRVMNAYGSLLFDERLRNVQNDVLELNLENRSPGIYFAEISDGAERTVRKIVLTR